MRPKWRIFYADGTSHGDEDGPPESTPGFGVVTIVQSDSGVGRTIIDGWDYYYWVSSDSKWWGSDLVGLIDRLAHRLECEAVCIGRMVSTEDWETIRRNARTHPDFPPKSGTRAGENPRRGEIKFRGSQ